MPRAFDSADREQMCLRFTENVECPSCGTVSEGVFHDDSMTVEDMAEAPTGDHHCPGCQHRWVSQMTGWTLFNEAG